MTIVHCTFLFEGTDNRGHGSTSTEGFRWQPRRSTTGPPTGGRANVGRCFPATRVQCGAWQAGAPAISWRVHRQDSQPSCQTGSSNQQASASPAPPAGPETGEIERQRPYVTWPWLASSPCTGQLAGRRLLTWKHPPFIALGRFKRNGYGSAHPSLFSSSVILRSSSGLSFYFDGYLARCGHRTTPGSKSYGKLIPSLSTWCRNFPIFGPRAGGRVFRWLTNKSVKR
jgi:hypothetical protein